MKATVTRIATFFYYYILTAVKFSHELIMLAQIEKIVENSEFLISFSCFSASSILTFKVHNVLKLK